MKRKFQFHNPTDGSVTAEACICSAIIIFIFAFFLTLAGYCRSYVKVSELIDVKAKEISIIGYATGITPAGVIPVMTFSRENGNLIKNLFVYGELWGDEVNITASYKYKSLLGDFNVRIYSSFTKWKGDGGKADGSSVWGLSPIERGRKIERIFGGGLPGFFPLLDCYDPISGRAAVIVSIDTVRTTYINGKEMEKVLKEKADEFASYEYGCCEDIIVTRKDIDVMELIAVLPENKLNMEQINALDRSIDYAKSKNIRLIIKRYQKSPEN